VGIGSNLFSPVRTSSKEERTPFKMKKGKKGSSKDAHESVGEERIPGGEGRKAPCVFRSFQEFSPIRVFSSAGLISNSSVFFSIPPNRFSRNPSSWLNGLPLFGAREFSWHVFLFLFGPYFPLWKIAACFFLTSIFLFDRSVRSFPRFSPQNCRVLEAPPPS